MTIRHSGRVSWMVCDTCGNESNPAFGISLHDRVSDLESNAPDAGWEAKRKDGCVLDVCPSCIHLRSAESVA